MDNPGGHVLRIDEIRGTRHAEVDVKDGFSCPRCAAGKGCGAGLSASGYTRAIRVRIDSGLDVHVGDAVRIEFAPRDLLLASWLVYGLPLAAGVLSAALAYAAGLGDAASALAALAGLVTGALYSRRRLGTDACLRRFTPRIVATMPVTR